MARPNDILWFDIETGGRTANRSSILQFSYAKGWKGKTKTLFANPSPGSQLFSWSERNIWEKQTPKAKWQINTVTLFSQYV